MNETENGQRKKRLNTLQRYLLLFFVVALVLVVMAGVFQSKMRGDSQNYENIIRDKENTILTTSSLTKDLQSKYESLMTEKQKLETERDALAGEKTTLEGELSALNNTASAGNTLFAAQAAYNKRQYSECRKLLSGINADALSPEALTIYKYLKNRL